MIQGAVVGGAGRIMAVDLTVDIPRSVDLYLEGKLDLDTPIAHRYALEEVNEAFAAMGRGVIAFPGLPVVAST